VPVSSAAGWPWLAGLPAAGVAGGGLGWFGGVAGGVVFGGGGRVGGRLPGSVPPVSLPGAVPFGGGGDGVGGGSGFFFFFGVAGLVALAGLLVPRGLWALGVTVRPALPQPFICLLERPG
jgi:hypothetical protein